VSLIDQAKELESVADADLINMASQPDSRYPSMLVVAEMKRRKDLRDAYNIEFAKQNQQDGTVVDRLVGDFSQGAMPSDPRALSSSASGLASIAPNPDMMPQANQGLMRMNVGGDLPLSEKSDEELIALGFDPDTIKGTPRSRRRRLSPEEIERNRLNRQVFSEAFSRTPIGSGLSNIYDFFTQRPDEDVGVPRAKPRVRNGNQIIDLESLKNDGDDSAGSSGKGLQSPSEEDILNILGGSISNMGNLGNQQFDNQGLGDIDVQERLREYRDSLGLSRVMPKDISDADVQENLRTAGLLGLGAAVGSATNFGELATGIAKVGQDIMSEKERLETRQLERASAERTQQIEEADQAIRMVQLDIQAATADKASDAQFFNLVSNVTSKFGDIVNPEQRQQVLQILREAFRVRGLEFPEGLLDMDGDDLAEALGKSK
jgi:hypothetical protein